VLRFPQWDDLEIQTVWATHTSAPGVRQRYFGSAVIQSNTSLSAVCSTVTPGQPDRRHRSQPVRGAVGLAWNRTLIMVRWT